MHPRTLVSQTRPARHSTRTSAVSSRQPNPDSFLAMTCMDEVNYFNDALNECHADCWATKVARFGAKCETCLAIADALLRCMLRAGL